MKIYLIIVEMCSCIMTGNMIYNLNALSLETFHYKIEKYLGNIMD